MRCCSSFIRFSWAKVNVSFRMGLRQGELALLSTQVVSSGIIISTYTPVGSLRTGSFADTSA